jgi:hypothetical protein
MIYSFLKKNLMIKNIITLVAITIICSFTAFAQFFHTLSGPETFSLNLVCHSPILLPTSPTLDLLISGQPITAGQQNQDIDGTPTSVFTLYADGNQLYNINIERWDQHDLATGKITLSSQWGFIDGLNPSGYWYDPDDVNPSPIQVKPAPETCKGTAQIMLRALKLSAATDATSGNYSLVFKISVTAQ